jgi:acyl-CoA thioester hydrolase
MARYSHWDPPVSQRRFSRAMDRDMPEPILTCRSAIYSWHCDHMGRLNVRWDVGKLDERTWNLLSAVEFTPAYAHEHAAASAGVEETISYKREPRAGDTR